MRHAAFVLVVVAGCGEVVDNKTPDASTIDAAPDGASLIDAPTSNIDAPPDSPPGICGEAFDSAALDAALWMLSDADNTPIVLNQTGGRFRATIPNTPPITTAGGNQITSRASFPFAGSTTVLQVINLPADQETQSYFLVGNATFNAGFTIYGNQFFRAQVGAAGTVASNTDRYWRVREAAGTTYVESSANGIAWTVRQMGTTPAITTAQIKIGAALDTGPGGIYEADNLTWTGTGTCPLRTM